MGQRLSNAVDVKTDLQTRVPAIPNNEGEFQILKCEVTYGDMQLSVWQYDSTSTATDDFAAGVVKPTSVAGAGRWLRLGYIPLSPVALAGLSGAYSDLTGKPTIPSAPVNADWNSSSGLSQILNKPSLTPPGNNNAAGYGTGTAYTLTTSSAKITMGTTSPTITIPAAGTYLIMSNVTIDYNGLTTLAVAACNFKIRRTNNTASDIANTSTNFNVPVVTLLTQTGGDADLNAIIYTTSNNNDVLELWGSRGAISVGSITITNGYIVAVKLY